MRAAGLRGRSEGARAGARGARPVDGRDRAWGAGRRLPRPGERRADRGGVRGLLRLRGRPAAPRRRPGLWLLRRHGPGRGVDAPRPERAGLRRRGAGGAPRAARRGLDPHLLTCRRGVAGAGHGGGGVRRLLRLHPVSPGVAGLWRERRPVSGRLVTAAAALVERRTSRRGLLARAALAGSAMAVAPLRYLLRPGTAWAVI